MKKAVFGVLLGSITMCAMMAMGPKTGKLSNNNKTHLLYIDTTPGTGKHKNTDTSRHPKDITRLNKI